MAFNHVQEQASASLILPEGEAKGPNAKVPLGRTQSAQPYIFSEASAGHALNNNSEGDTIKAQDSTNSEILLSHTNSSLTSSGTGATSSPSRESKEKAEEVARKVVCCCCCCCCCCCVEDT